MKPNNNGIIHTQQYPHSCHGKGGGGNACFDLYVDHPNVQEYTHDRHVISLVSKVSSNIVSFEKGEHKRPTFSCRFHCLISTSHKSKAPAPQPAIGALPSEHDDAACYCCGGGGGGVNGVPSRPKNKPILLYAPMAWIER